MSSEMWHDTLSAQVLARLRRDADAPVYTWLNRTGSVDTVFTGRALEYAAHGQLARLREYAVPGSVIALALPSGPAFYHLMLACMMGGYTLLPLPVLSKSGPGARRVETALEALRPDLVVCESGHVAALVDHCRELGLNAPVLAAECAPIEKPIADIQDPEISVLQLTSGTTGVAKAVRITPTNVLANSRYTHKHWAFAQDDLLMSWLPHFHDLGLFGCLIYPLTGGYQSAQMPTLAFVQRPARWLNALQETKATTTGAPAFAFRMCLDMIAPEDLGGFDLSRMRRFFCGAEPIPPALLDEFATEMSPTGLPRGAVFGTYGMAEATLLIAGHQETGTRAECLVLIDDTHQTAIIDPESRETLPDGTSGEIVYSGPSVCAGYTRPDPELFFEDATGRRWLRTGDLGHIQDGWLTISGRLKDVLIAGGVNYAASEVEWLAAQADAALNPYAASAVTVGALDAGEVALMIEVKRGVSELPGASAIARHITQQVRASMGLDVIDVVFLRAGTLERTSSGKIRRAAARSRYAQDAFTPNRLNPVDAQVLANSSNSQPYPRGEAG